MKRIISIALGIIVISIIAYNIWKRAAEPPVTAKAGNKGPAGPTLVQVEVVGQQELERQLSVTGTLMPDEQTDLKTEVAGRVATIQFQEGQVVKKGQVLLSLVADDLEANIRKTEYNLELARTFDERQQKLLAKEAISQQEYDQARNTTLATEADLANLKAQLAKTVVRAPFDGQVGLRYVSLGSYLSPGSLITTLVSTNQLKLDFAIPARYAHLSHVGMPINFTVEGQEKPYQATVYALDPVVDPATRTLKMRAKLPSAGNALRPGAFASVKLVLEQSATALTIPTEAIVPDGDKATVFVVRQGKATPQPVARGQRKATRIEIKQGLSLGDSVIVVGVQLVKPGGAVQAIEKEVG